MPGSEKEYYYSIATMRLRKLHLLASHLSTLPMIPSRIKLSRLWSPPQDYSTVPLRSPPMAWSCAAEIKSLLWVRTSLTPS